ncbi:MAG: response regulator, partial [Desulfobulbaceae bacterium]|nr:response regulator [Desulfobulbaceae bacterium]
ILSTDIIRYLAKYLDAQIGTLFVSVDEKTFVLAGSYAFFEREGLPVTFELGQGLIGEAAREKKYILLSEAPDDYIRIESSLGSAVPKSIIVMPVIYEERVMGVMELGSFMEFDSLQIEFLTLISESIAIAIHSVQETERIKGLLQHTQAQSEELMKQQSRLRISNEQLQAQQEELQSSNEQLQAQEEELRAINEELEAKTRDLEDQKREISEANRNLEQARKNLVKKAEELEISSKYKSEFLANMSHELRTPLNSLLLLSNKLAGNRDGNLTEKQVDLARIIYNSGNTLLSLINEILDLAKIESGKMDINVQPVAYQELKVHMENLFGQVMSEKGLEFKINIASDLPKTLRTDQQRLEQILRNLLSNAAKFTSQGSVTVDIKRPGKGADLSKSGLAHEKGVTFTVTDTGIGVPENKQHEIFEAFQQVDGSTARQYGGTGLGLSITRELAKYLGGEVQLTSEKGAGSTFTLFVSSNLDEMEAGSVEVREDFPEIKKMSVTVDQDRSHTYAESIQDDRGSINESDKVVLLIEDDMDFARILYDICHEKGFKCIHAVAGEKGLAFASEYRPHAIILDLSLPGIQGGQVLDMLKNDVATRHIPVHIISAAEKNGDVLKRGAVGYLKKPVTEEQLDQVFTGIKSIISKGIKDLLIVENDESLRKSMEELFDADNIKITSIGKGRDALKLIKAAGYDCMILDLMLPDISGFEVLKEMSKMGDRSTPPVIIYTGKELTKQEQVEINKYADSVVLKGVKSDERLLDEATLFLHTVIEEMGDDGRARFSRVFDSDAALKGKKVLVVDDDMRNLFALTDELEDAGMIAIKATDGKEALDVLNENSDIDLVLMDIMMPVMDGYEAMGEIRKHPKYSRIPIFALTAKAMREDRKKCIDAGANDYLPKPVDIDRLFSTMRVWLRE